MKEITSFCFPFLISLAARRELWVWLAWDKGLPGVKDLFCIALSQKKLQYRTDPSMPGRQGPQPREGGAHQCHVPSVFSFRLLHGSACSIHESTGCWKRANTTEATWQAVTELWFCVLPARCLRAATVSSAESEELTNVWTPASVRNVGHILRTRGPSVTHIANSDGLFS